MDDLPADDGFKWFGEGFDGFPKRLPDDCVEYIIYAIDERLRERSELRTRLNEYLAFTNDFSKKHLTDYIWQRDAFQLKIQPNHETQSQEVFDEGLPRLKGRTEFGDSVADEWLVVYILLELSKMHPDAWIRVYDTDGEFLLIEAANALPKWLNPDMAENRVWLSNGHIRIIPLDDSSSKKNLPIQGALDFIRSMPEKLLISPFIEDKAFARVREYPTAISSSLHNALVTIPRPLACILHKNPSYISPAVEALYLRDPVSLKPLTTKDLSTLSFSPEDFVTTSIRFTKVGYAQLKSQIFEAPPAWTGIIPRLQDPKVEMGMKVTCGFEMLLQDPQRQDARAVREMKLILADIENGDEQLPPRDEIEQMWANTQDDEQWLDIDYREFEKELSGKKGQSNEKGETGVAQENLKKMMSRFEDFLNDDSAGIEGIDADQEESDSSADNTDEEGEDKDGSFNEAEFERAMKEMMGMPPDEIEKSGLLDEARRLAVEDAEGSGDEMDEDEEMKKVMELMEKELKSHGALKPNGDGQKETKNASKAKGKEKKVAFGPEPPPGLRNAMTKAKAKAEDDEFPIGPGDEELSSDDEEFNDVDVELARNMLESFKGQAGMAGPAGNLMKAMGVNMPRDEAGSDEE